MKNKETLSAIADKMRIDLPTLSKTYLQIIARECLRGIDESKLNKDSSVTQLVNTSKKSMSVYFCTWSDDMISDLAASFSTAFKSL